jgi:hypothetical protein
MDIDTKPPKVRGFTLWKIFRLIILGALVVVLGLMVQRPERSPDSAGSRRDGAISR